MNKKQEIKIAKNIFAMTYEELENLYSKYQEPDVFQDIMQQFKRFSKLIQKETVLKNNKNWWKIWKDDFDPEEIEDELLDAIAHKVFLKALKTISYIVEIKQKLDNFLSDSAHFSFDTKTREQIEKMLSILKDLSEKIKYVERNKDKVKESLTKMRSNINKLEENYKDDEKYNGVIDNKVVKKLMTNFKKTISDTSKQLDSNQYKLQTPAVSPRIYKSSSLKKADAPAEGYKKALQNLINQANIALSSGNYKKENSESNTTDVNTTERNTNTSTGGNFKDKLTQMEGEFVDLTQTSSMIQNFINKDEPFKAPLKNIIGDVSSNMVEALGDITRQSDDTKLRTVRDKFDKYVNFAFSNHNIDRVAGGFKTELDNSVFKHLKSQKYAEFYNGINNLIRGGLKDYFKNNIIPDINKGFTLTKSNNDWFNNAARIYFNQLKNIKNKFVQEVEKYDPNSQPDEISLRVVKASDKKQISNIAMKIAKSLI